MSWPVKTFTVGEILPASDLNTYLRDPLNEIDPTGLGAGAVLFVNSGEDGFDSLAPAAGKFLRFNEDGDALEAADVTIPMPNIVSIISEYKRLVGAPGTAASGSFMNANQAWYAPFFVTEEITIKRLGMMNGTTATGNVDVGIYDSDEEGMPANRLTSSGSTAQSGTSAMQFFNVSDVTLAPGLYWLAVAASSTSATSFRITVNVGGAHPNGYDSQVLQEAGAFPLPATANGDHPGGTHLINALYAFREA